MLEESEGKGVSKSLIMEARKMRDALKRSARKASKGGAAPGPTASEEPQAATRNQTVSSNLTDLLTDLLADLLAYLLAYLLTYLLARNLGR